MINELANPKHGGNAFPLDCRNRDGIGYMSYGMTLRDYFAAKAMQGLLAADNRDLIHEYCAADAYRYADAMLEARK
jgi:hypothetical protein